MTAFSHHGPRPFPGDDGPLRLDRALAATFGISRSAARRAIAAGGAYLDGRRTRIASRTCAPGAVLECHVPDGPVELAAEPRVVLADRVLAVVDKPAGVATAATRETDRGTLEWWARRRFGPSVHLPQRLDRRASGLLMVVLDRRHHRAVARAFRRREVTRVYRVEVDVDPPRAEGRLESTVDGKHAALRYRRVEPRVLEVTLETGRTHQIRRQLAEIGCPVRGDARYGGSRGPLRLRAVRLAFVHPATGERVAVEADRDP